jgi:hypothetical protein
MPFVLSKWWTPPGCTDDVQMLLRPLSVAQWQELNRMATDETTNALACNEYLAEHGIGDWRGFRETEKEPEMPYSIEQFSRLPKYIQDAAFNAIQAMSLPNEEEEKNSASQSMSATKKPKAKARSTARTVSTGATATKPIRRRPRSSKTT